MMDRFSRWSLALLALALLLCLVTPIWRVDLLAPQYPEGLGFFIWASRMSGDLQSINGLNHYIGMREIVPDSIPELRLMPWAFGLLTGLGLAGAVWGRRIALKGWVALLATGAVLGLADFWKWGYDYGHNLDPTAAIKIPGMSYQPPVLGTKQLLNFQATSLPALGGWIAFAILTTGLVLILRERKLARQESLG